MSLLLTLAQGSRAQAVREARLDQGELVIGRSPEADWQIDDPDMFVSRAHCKITSAQDGYFVTDTSSSGLFIDDAGSPLGVGNSTRLENGMRLRMGEYVLWVELQTTTAVMPSASPQSAPRSFSPPSREPVSIGRDDFFSIKSEEEPQRPRPADLPNPFEQPAAGAFHAYERARSTERSSPAFDDPFSLDPVVTAAASNGSAEHGQREVPSGNDPFGVDPGHPSNNRPEPSRGAPPAFDGYFDLDPAAAPISVPPSAMDAKRESFAEMRSPAAWDLPASAQKYPRQQQSRPVPKEDVAQSPAKQVDVALRAFCRGMGLDETQAPARDAIAEMEKLGREYRMMMEGLMQLLRMRTEEKGNARVAQTMVGSSEVNPLKFLPTVDDALATILAERSPGFLAGEPAIADAIRDLAQHHVRTWRGIQGALRRMIDRFDPASLEEELKSNSTIETLLAGGRGAKLWELYIKRHREIAMSAESRFLGDIGADFRDAYEEE